MPKVGYYELREGSEFLLQLQMDVFSFHNQFWFLVAYLIGLNFAIDQWRR
jgi:hypothetical protein